MLSIVNSNGVPSVAKVIKLSTPDVAGPQITGVAASGLQTTQATITWNTNEPATSQVIYGLAVDDYPNQSPADSTADLSNHSVQLTGLSADTTYHYRVKSQDAWGNQTTSADLAFTTPSVATYSLSFNGTNQRVSVPNNAALGFTNNLTVEAWIKPSSVSGSRRVVSKNYYEVYIRPQGTGFAVTWRIRIGSTWRTVAPTTQYSLNQWHHIAATYNGSIMRLYVDGVQAGTRTQTGNIDAATGALTIGASGTSNYFTGKIDEVRISNIARYSANFAPLKVFTTDANVRALWHLNEGGGTVAGDATGVNNGSLINAPTWTTDVP